MRLEAGGLHHEGGGEAGPGPILSRFSLGAVNSEERVEEDQL